MRKRVFRVCKDSEKLVHITLSIVTEQFIHLPNGIKLLSVIFHSLFLSCVLLLAHYSIN